LNKNQLFDFLSEVEKKLTQDIQLIGAGGTAMTLLDLKPSTVDIDFTGPSEDISQFEAAHLSLHHGFRIDSWIEGQVLMVFAKGSVQTRVT
jgi:hypothetical protein